MDTNKTEEERKTTEIQTEQPENPQIKKRWFGRGIYGSKDVPIRLLDKFIGALIVIIVVMIVYFTVNGGFRVTFDTQGGSDIAYQKLRHSQLVQKPEDPVKPGYEFIGWYYDDTELPWNFELSKIGGDLTLTAKWKPAHILVKFDLNGGSYQGKEAIEPIEAVYGEKYGTLPVPRRDGYSFGGWEYSGAVIEDNTKITMTGEHVLTAKWTE